MHPLDAGLPFHALAIVQHGRNLVLKSVIILLEEGMQLSHPGVVFADDFLNGGQLFRTEIEIRLQLLDDSLRMRTGMPHHPEHPVLEKRDGQSGADEAPAKEGQSGQQPVEVTSAIGADRLGDRLASVLGS